MVARGVEAPEEATQGPHDDPEEGRPSARHFGGLGEACQHVLGAPGRPFGQEAAHGHDLEAVPLGESCTISVDHQGDRFIFPIRPGEHWVLVELRVACCHSFVPEARELVVVGLSLIHI
eukprot:13053955-Alexandrium_andersonii.AAC.1